MKIFLIGRYALSWEWNEDLWTSKDNSGNPLTYLVSVQKVVSQNDSSVGALVVIIGTFKLRIGKI